MTVLLAIIGLLAVLWLLSRALTKIGNGLIRLSEAMTDRVTTTRSGVPGLTNVNKIRNSIRSLKGEEDDHEYAERVRKEIEDLTDPS